MNRISTPRKRTVLCGTPASGCDEGGASPAAGATRAPRLRRLPTLLIALGLTTPAWAQQGVFELGSVVVTGKSQGNAVSAERVLDSESIATLDKDTVGTAVAVLPGGSLSRNSRNEDTVSLRGFDARQVPLYIDGVPLYVPYDGYVDFGRFTTFDLAQIRVAGSGASLMYGPNTLGGAINLVSRKPQSGFEGNAAAGYATGNERKAAVNLGGNQGSWYYQVGASYLSADNFPLPSGFTDYKVKPTDIGSSRENAYHTDQRLSLKLGITPNATDEYALGYVRQDGEKGNPVYTGTSNSGIRYWRWPYWDTDNLYFTSRTGLNASNELKTRIYRSTYRNSINAFSDARYAVMLNNTSFPSYYDDSSTGASVEWANTALSGHALQVALHYKEDKHEERNPLSPTKDYRDVATSVAIEDRISLSRDWNVRLGASHDQRDAMEVYYWPTGTTNANNAVAELSHTLDSQGTEIVGVLSHKTRFPTIKDRYSARMGAALPNPDLKPESANHLELGIKGAPWSGGKGQATVFFSRITDLMQSVYVPAPKGTCGTGATTCAQMQNVGTAEHSGLELSLEQALGGAWALQGAYTYLVRRNISDPTVELTDSPRNRLYTALQWLASDQWKILATLEAEQGRVVAYAATGKTIYRELGGFGIAGLKAQWSPRKDLSVDFGVSNLGDKWYELSDGFTMPGRTWFANASYRF